MSSSRSLEISTGCRPWASWPRKSSSAYSNCRAIVRTNIEVHKGVELYCTPVNNLLRLRLVQTGAASKIGQTGRAARRLAHIERALAAVHAKSRIRVGTRVWRGAVNAAPNGVSVSRFATTHASRTERKPRVYFVLVLGNRVLVTNTGGRAAVQSVELGQQAVPKLASRCRRAASTPRNRSSPPKASAAALWQSASCASRVAAHRDGPAPRRRASCGKQGIPDHQSQSPKAESIANPPT